MTKSDGNWMQEAFSKNKGKLHKTLNVPPGQKIPAKKLETATKSKNPITQKEAIAAQNAIKANQKNKKK